MESNENQLSSYYHPQPAHPHHHHHHHNHHHQNPAAEASPTNGLLPNTHQMSAANSAPEGGGGGPHMVFPHSVPSAAVSSSPLEPAARRKRGRPRKYGTPEQALAAKKAATASSHNSSFSWDKKDDGSLRAPSVSPFFSSSPKKSHFVDSGNGGQGFTAHVIDVAAGEDVGQKIMLFMQQSKREICILSASGPISNASLRQPATSGGNITYEGRFEIVSLCGSYIRTEMGGRSGGLSVCLSSTDGQIIGGGVGGPLKAAGPVQVIVGTFIIDAKEGRGGVKGDSSAGKLPLPIGGSSLPSVVYRSAVDSSGRNPASRGNDDFQGIEGSHFMLQPHGVHLAGPHTTDWRNDPDAISTTPGYELSAKGDRIARRQSPENGDYDQIQD